MHALRPPEIGAAVLAPGDLGTRIPRTQRFPRTSRSHPRQHASTFTHAFARRARNGRSSPSSGGSSLWALSAVLPDAGVARIGVGVRTSTCSGIAACRSLTFAACLAGILTWATVQMGQPASPSCVSASSCSLPPVARRLRRDDEQRSGRAFFAPFSGEDTFSLRAPSQLHRFPRDILFGRGGAILANEFLVIWIPAPASLYSGGCAEVFSPDRWR